VVFDYVRRNHSDVLPSRPLQQAVAGSIMGIGEVALLPLDVLKIRAQTNPSVLAGKGLLQIVRCEGLALYRGIGWTMARNAPGSFALFGGNSVCKRAMGLDETLTGRATVLQNTIASAGGALASIAVAQPLDGAYQNLYCCQRQPLPDVFHSLLTSMRRLACSDQGQSAEPPFRCAAEWRHRRGQPAAQ
jgi:hypothetical protein